MDDPELDDDKEKEPKDLDDDMDGDLDDPLMPGKKKGKVDDLLSLDDLGDEEEEVLPEDSFDDVDLW